MRHLLALGSPKSGSTQISPRYESLDIWRGVACLMVLGNHAVTYPFEGRTGDSLAPVYVAMSEVAARLWMGVPIFFVISGYCISAAADSHRRKNLGVVRYFARRFRRIFPPYWVVLATSAVLVGVGDVLLNGAIVRGSEFLRPWWFSGAQWFGSITLTELWRFHFFGGPKGLFLGHAWTLCYEEQFYAVCGLLLVLCPRRFFAGAALVTLGVAIVAAAGTAWHWPIDGFFFDGGWLQFAFGVELYRVLNYGDSLQRRLSLVAFMLVLLGTLSYGAALLAPVKNQPQQLFVASAFAALAIVLRPMDSAIAGSTWLTPIRMCGVMCYSLYLVHLPVINLLRAGLVASGISQQALVPVITLPLYGAVSIWLSWKFHLLIERRFMNSPVQTSGQMALARQ
ncbi:MAG: acyltransferase [Vicinamibacterales bacterium]